MIFYNLEYEECAAKMMKKAADEFMAKIAFDAEPNKFDEKSSRRRLTMTKQEITQAQHIAIEKKNSLKIRQSFDKNAFLTDEEELSRALNRKLHASELAAKLIEDASFSLISSGGVIFNGSISETLELYQARCWGTLNQGLESI